MYADPNIDPRNESIRRTKYKAALNSVGEGSDLSSAPVPKETQQNLKSVVGTPKEYFETTRNKLHLNQDSMIPIKEEKEVPSKEDKVDEKLEKLATKSDDVLLKVSTVFPFTWFVNDIIIDPYKVTLIFREFFWSEHVHSIMIKDILDVVVETSLFFATIKIVDQGYVENTVDLTYLKKEDAMKVRKIIQGLVLAHRQAVDLSQLHPNDIKSKTEEMGKVKGYDDDISV